MDSDRRVNELAVETAARLDRNGQRWAAIFALLCLIGVASSLFLVDDTWLAAAGAGIFGLGAAAPVINSFLQRRGEPHG
ncbi:hypothetical protein SAMN05421642_103213 [Rhodococcoides kyotonense]|uniref:Uncharacterized protein n=2 Tax=Rhodococcoides kyotonense TaxID=398843 RepID=A0A239FBB7_9NOCA|nr:hypothetical protein SAMN05421642_103213 [Rhodococcus kyotonensis]